MGLSNIFLTIIFMGVLALIAGICTDAESNMLLSLFNHYDENQIKSNTLKLFRRPVADIMIFISAITTLSSSIFLVLIYFKIEIISSILLSTIISVFVQVTYQITAFNGTIPSHSQHNQPLYTDVILDNLGHVISRSFLSILSLTLISYELTLMTNLLTLMPMIALFISLILGVIISITSMLHYNQIDIKSINLTTIDTESDYLSFTGIITGICYATILIIILLLSTMQNAIILSVILIIILLLLNNKQEKGDMK
ncbi:MAG: tetrahydromethanopterin S-methyltransferase subunit E [Methanobacteriaceae archaeon]|nr:tetrahydromethanopterin S-methyltransferase subunit E [Methanobacteriaceae archaeon]